MAKEPLGIEKRGEVAFALYQEAQALKQNIGKNFIMLGAVLQRLKEKGLYKDMEGEDATWTDCCKSIGIGRQYSYGLIGIYEKFIQRYQIPVSVLSGIDRCNLLAILPHINKKNVEEKIEQARHLSRHDLSLLLKQEKLPDDHVCTFRHIEYWQCDVCRESSPTNPNL